jgi:hypothetical protein
MLKMCIFLPEKLPLSHVGHSEDFVVQFSIFEVDARMEEHHKIK